jgi:SAM-dependent methyltransferase
MFEQVYLIRNMDVRPGDDVLELCLGSGVNALFAADVARRVAGVDVNPRALAFARFNERLNPGAVPLTFHEGSLFEPLEANRRFDTILVNPPFELVPRGETGFLHSDGGEDGLDVVRTLLDGVGDRMTPQGRLQMITWSPGTERAPLLVDLVRDALPMRRVALHVLDKQPLEPHLETFAAGAEYAAWREALRARSLTHLWFVFVQAATGKTPGVELVTPTAEIAACDAIADAWLPGSP